MTEIAITAIIEFWNVLSEMAPYLLFGFLVAGLLSVLISPKVIERHLGGRGILPVIKSTIFGIPLPLCSCGVIPVAASLRKHGANRGATTAFLLSTPQTGVDSILVTFSLLGPIFAVFRPLAALLTGVIGGSLVTIAESNQETESTSLPRCEDACCSGDDNRNKVTRALNYGFVTLPQDIGRALIIGLLIAGIVSALVPDNYFADVLGGGIGAMLVMMIVGIPLYICATASVPVAAALLAMGISPGAVLVFLMTGPATNAAAVTTIWKVLGKRTTVIYLGTVVLSALAAGFLLDYIFVISGTSGAPEIPWMLPDFVNTISAVILLGILGMAVLRSHHAKIPSSLPDKGTQTTLTIEGMTCSHCAQSVQRVLAECVGVDSVAVDLKGGKAIIGGKDVNIRSLRNSVEKLGYTVSSNGDS